MAAVTRRMLAALLTLGLLLTTVACEASVDGDGAGVSVDGEGGEGEGEGEGDD